MKNLVILGGGTAGWMTANLLQKFLSSDFRVHLVESANIGSIGVGEGSTPHLKQFFDMLNIQEDTWMPECHATYKNGISFVNWTNHLDRNQYFHPFPSATDRQTAGVFLQQCMHRLNGKNALCTPDAFFLSAQLSANALAPLTKNRQSQVPLNYAYHFDSLLLGKFLAKIALKAGVKHTLGKFISAQQDAQHNIKSIRVQLESCDREPNNLPQELEIQADFFIDASGFSSLLLEKVQHVDFESFANNLYNDSAIALPTAPANPLKSETRASALKFGWAWHIPLTNRTGNGYVFSSKYTNFERAETELRQHLNVDDSITARHLKMRVGRMKKAWKNNVVAIGLSQGFIEPLEATALHLVMESIGLFLKTFKNGEYTDQSRDIFNQNIKDRYEGIRDYIVCHYKVNTRNDSNYWQDNRAMTDYSENLKALLSRWDAGKDITPVLEERNMSRYYPAISWFCLLAGYGRFRSTAVGERINTLNLQKMSDYLSNTCERFMLHKDAIKP
ncbi:tryptophan halogenase family protein [Glaciecola petra]|uniref:Tryptophan halogenase family protein n=1 Tax=Glaciecola petra TaxID=3075602 RepID=A0ABU2ZPA3_9ALTE|nr:tryptophan halogenase family protein [Aestuariibacter sp. P117]MDT0594450.1 tryptophan halogenase family protein [Aestuariibacter sp. P117]